VVGCPLALAPGIGRDAFAPASYNPAMRQEAPASVSTALSRLIAAAISRNGDWLPFDRFMALALYAPGLGYYAQDSRKFGLFPGSGSDFVTAPELSSHFGQALSRQVRQALDACRSDQVWEFGAGSGALAAHLLDELGERVRRYTIVDVSGALRARQRERLAAHGERVAWAEALPDALAGVVLGNEVLDAMPVQLLHRDTDRWLERGVVVQGEGFAFADRPTALRPPADVAGALGAGSTTEIHSQAHAFVATLGERLRRGAAFFFDYGFPQAEYYHPQRSGGTLMCHRAHRADSDPLSDVGAKDITAHVDFTGLALAAQEAGMTVIGYTSQARFLMNCGFLEGLADAGPVETARAQKLLNEHEMGELFKVIAFAKDCDFDPIGFASGDRRHRL
jgi:SAM-dependent MidA family methyltransferase